MYGYDFDRLVYAFTYIGAHDKTAKMLDLVNAEQQFWPTQKIAIIQFRKGEKILAKVTLEKSLKSLLDRKKTVDPKDWNDIYEDAIHELTSSFAFIDQIDRAIEISYTIDSSGRTGIYWVVDAIIKRIKAGYLTDAEAVGRLDSAVSSVTKGKRKAAVALLQKIRKVFKLLGENSQNRKQAIHAAKQIEDRGIRHRILNWFSPVPPFNALTDFETVFDSQVNKVHEMKKHVQSAEFQALSNLSKATQLLELSVVQQSSNDKQGSFKSLLRASEFANLINSEGSNNQKSPLLAKIAREFLRLGRKTEGSKFLSQAILDPNFQESADPVFLALLLVVDAPSANESSVSNKSRFRYSSVVKPIPSKKQKLLSKYSLQGSILKKSFSKEDRLLANVILEAQQNLNTD